MPKFEFLDHPIDLKIKAYGRDLNELFINSALGLMTYLYPKNVNIIDHETKAKIKLKARDEKELLKDWLEELLELSNEKEVCYNDFYIDKINEEELVAITWGRRVKAKEDIKSVITDKLKLVEEQNGYLATLSFDI